MAEVGRSFARGHWQQWPPRQSTAVWEFLHSWWAHSLTEPDPAVPVHELLALCTEASGTLSPWLHAWEAVDHRIADRHLAEAAAHWEYDLLGEQLPWDAWENAELLLTELNGYVEECRPVDGTPSDQHLR
ncbi:hypothetical protein [Streptomyces sp. PR69]|uniref:hypothetical protein n=1 Tax=Streptomyces sp. PR69 TaxID=2984950 RepID=UPI002B274163|nr:hypothetical protein [Streptomyces sp. PR69]